MKEAPLPDGYILLSAAINQFAAGIWGGLRQPEPVRAVKKIAKKLSVGFGPWREKAGQHLTAAVRRGELGVYVAPDASRLAQCVPSPTGYSGPVIVPRTVLKRLITSRQTLQDDPIRPSLTTAAGDERLFALLSVGVLVVRSDDFATWYEVERARLKWPSQRSTNRILPGRPSKQTEAMRNAILGLVRDEKWRGEQGATQLRRLLLSLGRTAVPSADTLARMVEQMHHEIGDPALILKRRMRPRSQAA
jgi:hypothetical protein